VEKKKGYMVCYWRNVKNGIVTYSSSRVWNTSLTALKMKQNFHVRISAFGTTQQV